MDIAEQIGVNCLFLIKRQPWFPYKTGQLKFHATNGFLVNVNTYCINFSSSVAPYITYLEEGTTPHDIPGAFGIQFKKDGSPFGVGGRFNGKFHPGSTKHKGFIKDKSVRAIVDYISSIYGGMVEVL